MHDAPSSLSAQEKDLQLFLDSLGIKLPAFDPGLPNGYVVLPLDPPGAAWFEAIDNKAVLFAFRIQGRVYPISIIFIKAGEGALFCHSTLLLDAYGQETWMVPVLRKAVLEFFSMDADRQFAALEPSWKTVALKGQLDCRINWNLKPEIALVTDLFMEKFGEIREIPLFPTVYNYNNPYDQNLLEAAIPDLGGSTDILVMGSGAGLEAVCAALRYGVHVDATDINPVAVANTVAACRRTGTDHLVNARVSDGFKQVDKKYDAILFEAPLATNEAQLIDPNRYDIGGKLLRRVLTGLPAHLNAGEIGRAHV
jgi:hypothetical protein